MEPIPPKKEPSDNLPQDEQEAVSQDGGEEQGENKEEKKNVQESDITKALEKIAKGIEEVKENTTSSKNISALEKVEKSIDKLSGFLESFSLPMRREEEKKEEPVVPETPEVSMPDEIKYEYVRKRGGRVVKRQVVNKKVKA